MPDAMGVKTFCLVMTLFAIGCGSDAPPPAKPVPPPPKLPSSIAEKDPVIAKTMGNMQIEDQVSKRVQNGEDPGKILDDVLKQTAPK